MGQRDWDPFFGLCRKAVDPIPEQHIHHSGEATEEKMMLSVCDWLLVTYPSRVLREIDLKAECDDEKAK